MKCSHCRRTLPDDSAFCQYCGWKIEFVQLQSNAQDRADGDAESREEYPSGTNAPDPAGPLTKESFDAALAQALDAVRADMNTPSREKARFCPRCGGRMDSKTKTCTVCGKARFPTRVILLSALWAIIISGVAALILLTIFFIIPEI